MDSRYKTEEQVRFASMVDELVEKHGFNRSDVARLLKVSPSIVSQIMSGDRNPRMTLDRLQREYDRITGKTMPASLREFPEEHLVDDLIAEAEEISERVNQLKMKARKLKKPAKGKTSSVEIALEKVAEAIESDVAASRNKRGSK